MNPYDAAISKTCVSQLYVSKTNAVESGFFSENAFTVWLTTLLNVLIMSVLGRRAGLSCDAGCGTVSMNPKKVVEMVTEQVLTYVLIERRQVQEQKVAMPGFVHRL